MDWHRTFEHVPDEVVLRRIELQHAGYFASGGTAMGQKMDPMCALIASRPKNRSLCHSAPAT